MQLGRASRAAHRREGSVQVVVLLAMVALLGAAALALDTGLLLASRAQLQTAADAGAHAGIIELRDGTPLQQVASVAADVANLNWSAYGPGEAAQPADVAFGSFDLESGVFTPGGMGGATAIEVTARHNAPLVFAPVLSLLGLGLGNPQVVASGVAALGERDVMLVQDVTLSFLEEIDESRQALEDFSMAMVEQSLSGDRVGLITFAEGATEDLPLTPIPGELGAVLDAIDDFTSCTSYNAACYGTNIAPGIQAALSEFASASSDRAERVIVLVSDGVPCLPADPPLRSQAQAEAETLARRAAALAAAQAAEAADVSIFSVFLDKPLAGGIYCWGVSQSAADPDMMEQLATGIGRFYATPDEEDLDDILVSIVRGLPVKLVR